MIVCSVCTGRHHSMTCPEAVRYVEQCFDGTPDEYQPAAPPPPVDLTAFRAQRSSDPTIVCSVCAGRHQPRSCPSVDRSRRRAERHRAAAARRWRAS